MLSLKGGKLRYGGDQHNGLKQKYYQALNDNQNYDLKDCEKAQETQAIAKVTRHSPNPRRKKEYINMKVYNIKQIDRQIYQFIK